MVKDSHCQQIDAIQVHAKRGKGARQGIIVKVEHGEVARAAQARCLVLAHHLDAHGLDPLQVVVKGARRVGGGKEAIAGFQVVLGSPATRPAAHGHAGQQQVSACAGCVADGPGQQLCWRRHHHLECVFGLFVRVEQQHVLRAGADIYSQDLHGYLSRLRIAARV